jgi:hypothetical protein
MFPPHGQGDFGLPMTRASDCEAPFLLCILVAGSVERRPLKAVDLHTQALTFDV